jgi:hypothetical protein
MPEGTRTHQPVSHFEVVTTLEEALSFRHLSVVRDEYAISQDGMKMFGVMDLDAAFEGGRFSIGLRNANDKSMRLALTAGYRVFVCDNMAFSGDFTPLLHKHTAKFHLRDAIAIAVDRIHRGLGTLADQIKEMRSFGLTDNDARLMIYGAFMEKAVKGVPRNMMPLVNGNYFDPVQEDFRPRNLWSLSNAFTSAFKSLAPLKQFEATAKLAAYFANVRPEHRRKLDGGTLGPNLPIDNMGLRPIGDDRKQELKEETIDDTRADSGGTGDQIDTIIEDAAARAAA